MSAELGVQVSDQLLDSVQAGVSTFGHSFAYGFSHGTGFSAQLSQHFFEVALDDLDVWVGSELFEQIFHTGHIDLFIGVVLFEQRKLVVLIQARIALFVHLKLG
ncbi:hypothetical protein D3C75_1056620 [compost metagenome]